jgi:hypothetical protein
MTITRVYIWEIVQTEELWWNTSNLTFGSLDEQKVSVVATILTVLTVRPIMAELQNGNSTANSMFCLIQNKEPTTINSKMERKAESPAD